MKAKALCRLAPTIVAVLLAVSCASGGDGETTTTTAGIPSEATEGSTDAGEPEGETEPEEGEEHGGHQWSYDEDAPHGPHHWSPLCSTGSRQSPINVTGAQEASDADLPDITFSYRADDDVTVADSGHAIQVDYGAGSAITIRDLASGRDTPYRLIQFHFHAHSEHRIEGRGTPVEVHFVHQADDGSRAVIGVLVQEGAHNEAYAPVVDAARRLPAHPSGHADDEDLAGGEAESTTTAAAGSPQASAAVDVSTLLPDDRAYYRYSGSLTTPTPDCEENVEWHVMTEQIEMSAEQIAVFADRYEHGNARPVTREGADDLVDSRG